VNFFLFRLWFPVAAAFVLLLCPAAKAQQKFPLQIEIMEQSNVGGRVHVQEWAQLFQSIDRSAVFRKGTNGERTRVVETEFGNRKGVLAVGIIERNGTIFLGGQKFTLNDPEALRKVLDKLEKFGPGGPPRENSSWGLNAEELAAVLQMFAPRVETLIDFRSPEAAIESLQLPKEFKITFTENTAARRVLPAAQMGDISPNCKGLSKGTALAIALSQFGMGFRPMGTAEGSYVIEVDVGNEGDNLYPIGWKNQLPIFTALPAIGKRIPVDLEPGTQLEQIIQLLANKLEIPHFYSGYELLTDGKDISKITYSRKPDKLTAVSLIRILGNANHIGLDINSLRTDEAGSLFLWITTTADSEAFQERFKNSGPAPPK
jgi:hypothetical protein